MLTFRKKHTDFSFDSWTGGSAVLNRDEDDEDKELQFTLSGGGMSTWVQESIHNPSEVISSVIIYNPFYLQLSCGDKCFCILAGVFSSLQIQDSVQISSAHVKSG